MMELFRYQFAGNELWRIGLLASILLLALFIGKLARYSFLKAAREARERQRPYIEATMQALARSVVFFTTAVGLEIGLSVLNLEHLSEGLRGLISVSVDSLLVIAIAYVLYSLVDVVHVAFREYARRTESTLDDMLAPIVGRTLRILIIVLAILQIFQMLSDKPLTSILASLGIGGLAVALAAQDTLKNFFGSLVLITTRPFEVGDRVMIGEHDGPIEEVGLWSTRLRTFDGHLVTIPNSQLTNTSIRNVGKRPYIRRIMDITITYDTPPEKVDRALEILKELLDQHEGMHPDYPPRVFFADFGATALILRVIYWYHPPDYWAYIDFSERLNKAIFRRFNEEGIEFAFPTQTVFLAGDPKRPLYQPLPLDDRRPPAEA